MALVSDDRRLARTRVHASGAPRPMLRTTSGVRVSISPTPTLAAVPRHRRTARLVITAAVVLFSFMLGAAAFQTQLSRRQLTLDQLDRDIRTAHEKYDELRRERAELRSPGRLVAEASALGMQLATRTEFMQLSPEAVAAVQQSAGGVFDSGLATDPTGFTEFGLVKSIAGGTP